MIDISVNNLIKSFEIGSNVLDGLSFSVSAGEHVAILGRNGCGKTTLFRILNGDLDYDEGEVSLAKGRRIGLISQIPVYPDGWTANDVLNSSMRRLDNIQSRMRELEKQMESSSDASVLAEYDALLNEYEQSGGYEADSEIDRVANGLDIDASMRERAFDLLSGGEKTRVNLARLILEDTDILLLDEPTNHLDLHATEWLEDYVSHFKGTVLAISHDRFFLDRVAQRCIEITDGKAEFYSGNYSFFVQERQRRFEEKLKQYEKDSAKAEQLQRAADQLHLWAFMGNDKLHKRAFSLEKRIEKLKTTQRPTEAKKLSVKFKEASFTGDEAVVMAGITKSFGDRVLFEDFDIEIRGGEALAITGDNGSGKTTLLRIMLGDLSPDCGMTYMGPQIKCAFLPQIVLFENEDRSMLDSMLYECGCTPQQARDRLAMFGFRGEAVLKSVRTLSGGERSRLKLCMLMGSNINLLVLDEPTNHLDIASREWIEDALGDYEGTLVFVSHDRYFIEKFANRILSFEGNGKLSDYRGTYPEYLEFKKRQAVFEKAAPDPKPKGKAHPAAKKSSGKRSAAAVEKEILKLEQQLEALRSEAEENASDYIKLMELDEQIRQTEASVDALYDEWEQC